MKTQDDFQKMTDADFAEMLKPTEYATFDELLADLHRRNPDMANNHPEELDWQAIKAAGRRF